MSLQNFVDQQGPVISAAWLNAVDVMKETTVPAKLDAADLASTASPALGDALMGVHLDVDGAADRTQHDRNADTISVTDFDGADPTGATDSTAAVLAAIAAAALRKLALNVNGRFLYASQLVIPARVALRGTGWTSDSATSGRSHSCLIKNFDGVGVLFSGDDGSADGVHFDSIAGKTGDVVQVTGSRVRLLNGASTNGGGDGVRIGKTEAGASSINANCGVLCNWQSLHNGGWGVQFDHTNTSTDATFPLGAPDCNAWTLSHVVIGASGQPNVLGGIKFGNTIDNVATHLVIQDNTGRAIHCTTSARGNFITAYCEGNVAGGPLFDSGAKYNYLRQTSTLITSNEATDSDGTNQIDRALSATNGWASSQSAVANIAGAAARSYYSGANFDRVAHSTGEVEGTSGGLWSLYTKADGGSSTVAVTADSKQRLKPQAALVEKAVTLTYGATVNVNASLGNNFAVTATNGTAFAIASPSVAATGQVITITVINTSGGVLGSITWGTDFKLASWTSPATGFSRSISFRFNGTNWIEIGRTPADVPN